MAQMDVNEMYCACRDGDEATVKRLLDLAFNRDLSLPETNKKPSRRAAASNRRNEDMARRLLARTSINELMRRESNGSTCLHAAASNGHKQIVKLLIESGVPRRIYDSHGLTPLDVAKTEDIKDSLRRPEAATAERIGKNSKQETDWLFGQHIAEDYQRAVGWDCIKNRGIERTIAKFERNGIIPTDESKESKLLRFYFDEAKEKNDPTYLLKAYTVESPFYKSLNAYMATGGKRKVFKRLRRKWSGYYTGAIVKSPQLEDYRYSGITFRGMEVTPVEVEQYKVGVVLANKAFQSTSKVGQVAYSFACREHPTPGKVPLILIYTIVDRRSAIDITLLSEYQNEEEVLLVPGTLFIVDKIDKNSRLIQVYLRQLPFDG